MLVLDFLKGVDIFKGLNENQLVGIQTGCREKKYENGNRLFAEGEDADRLWIVIEGQVDLRFELPGRPSTEENTISSMKTAKTIGWSSFVPPGRYKLSAFCASETCSILQIEKEYLLDLFEKDVQLGYLVISNLTGVASTRFHRLQDSAA